LTEGKDFTYWYPNKVDEPGVMILPMKKEVVEPDYDFDEQEFTACDRCDGYEACEDFGCAYDLDWDRGSDDWG
jgi:hypothetical protein